MKPEYLSECYVVAYEKALEMTSDVDIAVNAAVAVLNCIANQSRLQTSTTAMNVAKWFAEYNKQMTKSATKKKKVNKEEMVGDNNG